MQPFLIFPVVAQSAISTSTITLIPGLVLGLCMMFDQWGFIRLCSESMFFGSCILFITRLQIYEYSLYVRRSAQSLDSGGIVYLIVWKTCGIN